MQNNTQRNFISGLSQDQMLLVQSLQVPLLVLDNEFRILFGNEELLTTFKIEPKEITGRQFFDLNEKPSSQDLLEAFRQLLNSNKRISNYIIPSPFEAGSGVALNLNASLLPYPENTILVTFNKKENFEVGDIGQLEEFFLQAPAAIAILNGPQLRYTFCNPRYEDLFNRKHHDIKGKSLRETFPEIEDQRIFEVFDQVFESGKEFVAHEFQVIFQRKGEKEEAGYFNFIAHPILGPTSEVTDIMIHAFEVTEQVQAKKKLEESEKRYRDLIHFSPSMIAQYRGEDMIIEIVNEAMLDTWGKGKDIEGQSLFSVLPEIKEQGFEEMIAEVFASGEPFKGYEMPVNLFRHGRPYRAYYNFLFHPRKDDQGKVIGIFHTATEVTPEAEMNRKIKASEAHYRQMADLMPDKITNNDPKGNPIYFNLAWREFSGQTIEEMKATGWDQTIHPEDLQGLLVKWKHSLETGAEYEIEYRIKNKDGEYLWQLTRGIPVMDDNGQITMWITTATDIQKLKEEDKRKEEFLKLVSHELKTPVTSIKGYVQLLLSLVRQNKDIPPGLPLTSSLERIDDQITRLTRLISEILDLSRLEYDRLELNRENLNINDLVEETVQDILYTNPQQQIEVTHQFQCEVSVDKDRMRQVLINFITNAIKYSPNGREVLVSVLEGPDQNVAVSIKDRGIGIPEGDVDKIFQRFYRSQKAEADTYSGFGIGLFLAKEIIERHQGEIKVESELGKGSVFTFFLPCLFQEKDSN